MSSEEVKQTIEAAIECSGIDDPSILYLPRLLSDNGLCYVSKALGQYLEAKGITHTRGKPYHPMTQGKIERYHRSMKNILSLENYYSPSELEDQIALFVDYYNNHRYCISRSIPGEAGHRFRSIPATPINVIELTAALVRS